MIKSIQLVCNHTALFLATQFYLNGKEKSSTPTGLVWYTNMSKESVYLTSKKELNSHRVGLVLQHGKRKCLHKKRVELPQDWFETPTWSPFNSLGTPIWLLDVTGKPAH